jgi:DNA-binding MarR family transcriptional regulator
MYFDRQAILAVFDLSTQHQDATSKIVAALERLGQVFRMLLWEEAKQHEISPIQIQFLVYLRYHPPEFCRVSLLAREFGLTQATVSDAVTSLESKGFVWRESWPHDGRVTTLKLTQAGEKLAVRLSTWANTIREQLDQFSPVEQEVQLKFLMQLIELLQKAGLVTIARMCLTCHYFQRNAYPEADSPHHCDLLNIPLANTELRFDCPEHTTVTHENY